MKKLQLKQGLSKTLISLFKLTLITSLCPITLWAKESTSVLPKGVFRGRVVTVIAPNVSDKYNENRELQNLSGALNRNVTFNDVVNGLLKDPKRSAEAQQLKSLMDTLNALQPGSSQNLVGSSILSHAQINNNTMVPAIEYGLNDQWSLGLRIPVVQQNVSVDFQIQNTNNSGVYANHYSDLSAQLSNGLIQAGDALALTEQKLFLDKGYEVPHSFSKTHIGDIEIGAKYKFFDRSGLILAVQPGMRLPTGSTESLSNILDKGTGTGAFAIGGRMIEELYPNQLISFGAMQELIYYFEDTRQRAVPLNSEDSLPSLRPEDQQVQDVTRQQAMEFLTEISSTLWFKEKTYSVWGAYQYFTKGTDSFSGPGNLYYQGLSENTDKEIHSAEIGFGYSSIPAYKRKEISIPFELKALYNDTLNGRNTPLVSYVRMDAIFYF